jgi:peptidoglycan/LPS O-acetylase OafA/YrhL
MTVAAANSNRLLRYEPSLDGIRGIAVLLVMAGHLRLLRFGGWGVDIFFVLSGYLITAILTKEFFATGAIRLGRFYARRALRLLPALLLLLVVLNVRVTLFDSRVQVEFTRWNSLGALFYLTNWLRVAHHDCGAVAHLWSLAVEEHFYLVWPPILALLLRRKLRPRQIAAILGFLVLVVIVTRLAIYSGPWSGAIYNRIYNGSDTHSDGLLIGSALALTGCAALSPRLRVLTGVVGSAVLVCFIRYGFPKRFVFTIGFTVFALGAAGLLAATVADRRSRLSRCLRLPPLPWIGRLSYSLYLWHYPVFAFAPTWYPALAKSEWLRVGVTCFCAMVSYYLIERPFLRLKRRFDAPRNVDVAGDDAKRSDALAARPEFTAG